MEKIFWIDLEMSGLDVENEVIIEVGVVITDLEFNDIESYHAVVKQPQIYIDNMDEWNTKHHGESGLIAAIPKGKDPAVVEADLCQLIRKHYKQDDRPIIAGNTIHQDRLFIDRYFTDFSELLHYRMLDVSSWKVIFNNKFKIVHDKVNRHRAVDDIYESIGELKTYLSYFSKKIQENQQVNQQENQSDNGASGND